nr:hypothetical protein CFP56_76634 [Quercus suber]
MAAANVARINHAEPGPIDTTLLTQQHNHRSEAIWNGQDPGTLTCHSRSSEFSNRDPMVVPTPDSFPYTPHASPSFTIPAFTSHPSPSLTIPAFTSHPSPTLTIPSSTPHPSPSPTIPHPSPSPTIPYPAPRPTIPPPTPHPYHGFDIRPPLPQSFPELSPIPSFVLGLHPTPPEMQ